MQRSLRFVAAPLLIVLQSAAALGGTLQEAGVLACVIDKWDEKEPEKGHKLVDYAGRCVAYPDDPAASKVTEECTGKYEYMPDGSWKGSGACTDTYKAGGTKTLTFEEGSHLKEFTYKVTGGTGKYEGLSGSGTYTNENLTDTLTAGRYKATLTLP
ncbi:MAG: hypothetical protein ACT4OU_03755 [Hyphomicrobium sp.]